MVDILVVEFAYPMTGKQHLKRQPAAECLYHERFGGTACRGGDAISTLLRSVLIAAAGTAALLRVLKTGMWCRETTMEQVFVAKGGTELQHLFVFVCPVKGGDAQIHQRRRRASIRQRPDKHRRAMATV